MQTSDVMSRIFQSGIQKCSLKIKISVTGFSKTVVVHVAFS